MTEPDSERIPDRVQFTYAIGSTEEKGKTREIVRESLITIPRNPHESPAISDHLSKKQMIGGEATGEE